MPCPSVFSYVFRTVICFVVRGVLPLIIALAWVGASFAQGLASGSITGLVRSPNGDPVGLATVQLSAADGPTRSTTTAPDGSFSFGNLASGDYAIRIDAPSFARYQAAGISVAVGRASHLTLVLQIASAQQTVQVSALTSALDATETSSVVNIDRDRVEEMPIPNRNYLTFALLSPQVAPANPAQGALNGGQSAGGFSFGGLRPGSNAVYLDGVNDDDEYSGGSRTELSPEAISDFQIVNHGFQASAGGGAGGSIDVQTRAGVNRVHGDMFTFVQNGALNGTPPLGRYPHKPDENRERAGLSLGGALRRDRTFYYIAGEQEIAQGEDVNDLSRATVETINNALRHYGTTDGLQLQTGFFPTEDQETELSGRLDQTLTERQALMLRYAFTNGRNSADAFNTDELTDQSARGSSFVADNSLNGELTSSFDSRRLNRLDFELAQRRFVTRTGQSPSPGPGILIPGVALFGTPYAGNDRHFETHLEFADTFSAAHAGHLLEAGARMDRVALRAETPDGAQGFFVFADLSALQSGNADFFTQSFGAADTNFDTSFTEDRFAGYAQDHWTRSQKLTIDYGLRYEYNRLPSSLPQDTLNFSPRLGIAWSPVKALVVRSGFGFFYDRYQLSTINRLLEWNGTNGFTQIVEDPSAAAIYRNGGAGRTSLPAVAPSIWQAQSGLRNPYSEVGSLEVERELPLQTTVTATYQFVHGVRLGRSSNVNLPAPAVLTATNAGSLGVSAPTAQQLGQLVFPVARLNPAFDAINQFATEANSNYNGATLAVNRQFQDNLEVLAGYTWSKTIDDASYDFEQPKNPYALARERALSLDDQRQRFTLSGLWLIGPDLDDPADAAKNARPSLLMRALTGFEFTPIVSVTSGFRANPLTGLDSNREHIFPFADRPIDHSRNTLATPANIDFDMRVLRMVPIASGHLDIVAESFNLLNHTNDSLLETAFGSGLQPLAQFAAPIATADARRLQFSLDYEF